MGGTGLENKVYDIKDILTIGRIVVLWDIKLINYMIMICLEDLT